MELCVYLTHRARGPAAAQWWRQTNLSQSLRGFKETSDQHISLMAFSNALKSTLKVYFDRRLCCSKQDWQTLQYIVFFLGCYQVSLAALSTETLQIPNYMVPQCVSWLHIDGDNTMNTGRASICSAVPHRSLCCLRTASSFHGDR